MGAGRSLRRCGPSQADWQDLENSKHVLWTFALPNSLAISVDPHERATGEKYALSCKFFLNPFFSSL
jgi:hypothetical protein